MAYFGTFGYELDITKLTEKELEQMKEQITFMKQHRDLIQKGNFTASKVRLKAIRRPGGGRKDGSEGLMAYFRVRQPIQGKLERIYFSGLEETKACEVRECFGEK